MRDGPVPVDLREAQSGGRLPIKVLICEDQEVLRHGLRTALRRARDITVVGEAADAEEALTLSSTVRPDVTLVGLETTGPVVENLVRVLTGMGVRVILLGEASGSSDLADALRAGARGYVLTTVTLQRLVEGIRAVAAGETFLDAALTGELLLRLDEIRRTAATDEEPVRGPLTARQRAVSLLVAEGLTNAEIAAQLHVSRATVKGHITVALRRLGLRDRTQLAIYVSQPGRAEDWRRADRLGG
jgi:DNA-binding NarL/FixJ family response regulator